MAMSDAEFALVKSDLSDQAAKLVEHFEARLGEADRETFRTVIWTTYYEGFYNGNHSVTMKPLSEG